MNQRCKNHINQSITCIKDLNLSFQRLVYSYYLKCMHRHKPNSFSHYHMSMSHKNVYHFHLQYLKYNLFEELEIILHITHKNQYIRKDKLIFHSLGLV